MSPVFSRPAFAAPPDSGPETDGFVALFTPGTRIATPAGPRAVELLSAGDSVMTHGGARRIVRTELRSLPREDWTYRRALWPIRVPVGSLGNAVPLRLAPQQRVWLAGPTLETEMGVAGLWAPVEWLTGLRGLASERPLGTLRQYGLTVAEGAGGKPLGLRAEGVWCALDLLGDLPDRERLRAAYQAMNAAGEPPLAE